MRPETLLALANQRAAFSRTSAGRSFLTTTEKPPGTLVEVASTLPLPGLLLHVQPSQSPRRTTVASELPMLTAISPACG